MSLAALLRRSGKRLLWGCCISGAYLASGSGAMAASPSVDQALSLQPVQKDVEYDKPAGDAVAKCTIAVEKAGGISGWVVKDEGGRTLRRFVDTNADNTVDQWSYFADGMEVYRDVDSNANGKADQFRWLNTGGSRWALDTNEDGKIDSWKSISAEEVSSEAVQAMAQRDTARFQRLLLSADELKSLGVGDKYGKLIDEKLAAAPQRFTGLVSDSKVTSVSNSSSRWLNFSGTKPGLVPAGSDGTTKDVLVYENVAAMMETGEKTSQVQIGTMIRVGDVWRLVDAPKVVGDADQLADSAIFFNGPAPIGGDVVPPTPPDQPEVFKLLDDVDAKLAKATSPKEAAALKKERTDLLEQKIVPSLKAAEDLEIWTRQLIDALAEGVQSGTNPEFLDRLKALQKKLEGGEQKHLAPYARFSAMTAEYIKSQTTKPEDFVKVQAKWLEDLKQFVKDYPKAPETAEALLHLAIDSEYAGQEANAKQLYGLIVTNFPQSATAKKAAGSIRRLDSIGKVLSLQGTTVEGKALSVASFAGKPVIVYYWASNGATAAGEIAIIKQVQAKYARDIHVIGVSLDHDKNELNTYLQQNRVSWPNLFEAGGMEGRFANEMGILTIPTILLLDGQGKVVNRGLHISELEREVANVVKR